MLVLFNDCRLTFHHGLLGLVVKVSYFRVKDLGSIPACAVSILSKLIHTSDLTIGTPVVDAVSV